MDMNWIFEFWLIVHLNKYEIAGWFEISARLHGPVSLSKLAASLGADTKETATTLGVVSREIAKCCRVELFAVDALRIWQERWQHKRATLTWLEQSQNGQSYVSLSKFLGTTPGYAGEVLGEVMQELQEIAVRLDSESSDDDAD